MSDLLIDLEKLENLITTSSGWQARCPACAELNEDKRSKNHLGIERNGRFNCLKYSDKEHRHRVLELVGVNASEDAVLSRYSPVSQEPDIEFEGIYPEDLLTRLVKDYSYWLKRGVSEQVIAQYEGGVALQGKLKNRYCFVMRNDHGQVHGFDGRYIYPIKPASGDYKEPPRYKKLGDKKKFVFDRKRVEQVIKRTKKVILVEGVGCVLALREVGIDYAIPIYGVEISSHVLSKLIAWGAEEVIISLNNEESEVGNVAAYKTKKKLLQFFSDESIKIRLPNKKDWLDCDIEERYKFKNELEQRNNSNFLRSY
jgi:hypothetical protein